MEYQKGTVKRRVKWTIYKLDVKLYDGTIVYNLLR